MELWKSINKTRRKHKANVQANNEKRFWLNGAFSTDFRSRIRKKPQNLVFCFFAWLLLEAKVWTSVKPTFLLPQDEYGFPIAKSRKRCVSFYLLVKLRKPTKKLSTKTQKYFLKLLIFRVFPWLINERRKNYDMDVEKELTSKR